MSEATIMDHNVLLDASQSQTVSLSEKAFSTMNANRKRPCNPPGWKDVKAKYNRTHGNPSQGRNGTLKPGKAASALDKLCWNRCQLEGCLLNVDLRQRVFQGYYNLNSWETQRTYLQTLMRREASEDYQDTYRYYFNIQGVWHEACRKTWMTTFQISKSVVEKMQNNISRGYMFVTETRGKYVRNTENTEDLKRLIRQHVDSFPKYETHYARERQGDFYLSPDLNVMLMFRLFVEANPNLQDINSKETMYRNVFQKMKYKIGQPRADTCKRCDRLKIQSLSGNTPEIRQGALDELSQHHSEARMAYNAMTEDTLRSREDPSYVVLAGDMQKVMFTPTLTHSEMFYRRQYSSYNYCLYNAGENVATMCFWTESTGRRGVNDVVSCLLRFVQSNYNILREGEPRKLTFWSDRCRGQTNNFQILCAFKYLIQLKYFTAIQQKFLCSGHSFLPCDRLFALIEKRKKVCSAIVPNELIDIIRSSVNATPFLIQEMTQDHFFDFASMERRIIPRPVDLRVSEVAWIFIDANTPSIILSRSSFAPNVWNIHNLYAPNQRGRINARLPWTSLAFNQFHLIRAYNGTLPMNPDKLRDLLTMVPYMLPQYREFYTQLRA